VEWSIVAKHDGILPLGWGRPCTATLTEPPSVLIVAPKARTSQRSHYKRDRAAVGSRISDNPPSPNRFGVGT